MKQAGLDRGALRQQTLPFGRRSYGFAEFVAEDRTVVDWLQGVGRADRHHGLLVGASGVGKSHLMLATCGQAHAMGLGVAYIPLAERSALAPQMLHDLDAHDLVCFDDVGAIAGERAWEQAVFACYNACDDAGRLMLFAAGNTASALPLELADLQSRLAAAVVLRVNALDDHGLTEAMMRRADAGGFRLVPAVAEFLIRRFPRDMHVLAATVDRIASLSLAEQRRVTVPAVSGWLTDGLLGTAYD
ncbi:MAG: DnaA/Hda family protein [Pseudomonadota bacterium]